MLLRMLAFTANYAAMRWVIPAISLVMLVAPTATFGQPEVAPMQRVSISNGLKRLAGEDKPSGIGYVRLFLDGALLPESGGRSGAAAAVGAAKAPEVGTESIGTDSNVATATSPTLTAQCTRSPSGRLGFELFANFGGVDDFAFYPPWRPTKTETFPPKAQKVNVTMEFLGYTHVKPVKRQWEFVEQPSGQLRYNSPSGDSANMEGPEFYLRYMLALPKLRLTLAGKTAEFNTAPLLDQLRKEPMCKASGI